MKNRIWYKIKSICMTSVLVLGIMGGCCGELAGASAGNVENQKDLLTPGPVTAIPPTLTPEISLPPTKEAEEQLAPTVMPEVQLTPAAIPEETDMQEESESEPTPSPEDIPDEAITPTSMPEISPEPTSGPEPGEGKEETPETMEKSADFRLTMEGDTEQIKAGQVLTYEVVLENCGDVPLKDLQFKSSFAKKDFKGHWEEAEGLAVKSSLEASLDLLETGRERKFYYQVRVPEDYQETVTHTVQVSAQNPIQTKEEEPYIIRSTSVYTEILPLKVDFEVKKTADRKTAAPGDTITYQICIRNTGERTIHSVLTTERFYAEDIRAEFVEKEGVVLNGTRNQALIGKIEPGEAFGLQAVVTLPEEIASQKLLNEVVVVTKETGKKTVKAQADIQIYAAEATKAPTPSPYVQGEEPKARPASASPKTGDTSDIEALAGAMGLAMLAGVGIFWYRKAKRKH